MPIPLLLKGDEGGSGGHYPLGHLRRGRWINLSVRVTGDPAKGESGGEAPRPRPPPLPHLLGWYRTNFSDFAGPLTSFVRLALLFLLIYLDAVIVLMTPNPLHRLSTASLSGVVKVLA